MIRNYLAVFFRSIFRYKVFSLLNVFGITLGLTCFTVIGLFVEFEFSYDTFHDRPENIYRVVKDFVNIDGARVPDATTPPALAPALRAEVPEVEAVTRFVANGGRQNLFQYGDKQFNELELLRIDSSFFQVFDFKFIRGNKSQPFRGVHSMVLTESTARKYFGGEDPIGKIIRTNFNNQTDFEVTAVVKDVPANSHFKFQVLIPFQNLRNADTDWTRHTFYTYARLKPGSDPTSFQRKVQGIVASRKPDNLDVYHIQAIQDIHLQSSLKGELNQNGDLQYVQILIMIGVFVLLLAGVNYVNLTTAQSLKRAKEIGVRKVTGAFRRSLIGQFLMESITLVFASSLIALGLTSTELPYLVPVYGIDLSDLLFQSDSVRIALPLSVLSMGILAGLYPAFYLSSFRPLTVLHKKWDSAARGIRLRQGLVVFQFVISSSLIIAFLVIQQQVAFIKNKDLGFNQHAILVVPNATGNSNAEAIAEDFRKLADVKSVARASGGILGVRNSINGVGDRNGENRVSLNFMSIDYDFVATMGIELIEGRNFSPSFISDTSAIIINETAALQLGLQEPIVGQPLTWDDQAGVTRNVRVVGVVKDFHFTSFHEEIRPFGFVLGVGNGTTFFLKVNGSDITSTLVSIEKVWKKHNDNRPFEYAFQDEYTANLYASEERFQKLFSLFTMLAIAVACLGLFGLVMALSESKTKEIGIRKVLGSSVPGIIGLLTKEFIMLILIAFTIASPVSFMAMGAWLEGFAYRIDLQWHLFAIAGAITVMIALVTVCFQSLKAALANPVNSLRSD